MQNTSDIIDTQPSPILVAHHGWFELLVIKNTMSKIKKYGKFGKKMLVGASSGIIAGMFLMGVGTPYRTDAAEFAEYSAPAYSQNSGANGMHTMRRWNSKAKINSLVNTLGLDQTKIQAELKAGKNLKQILAENGVETTELQKAFVNKHRKNKAWK